MQWEEATGRHFLAAGNGRTSLRLVRLSTVLTVVGSVVRHFPLRRVGAVMLSKNQAARFRLRSVIGYNFRSARLRGIRSEPAVSSDQGATIPLARLK